MLTFSSIGPLGWKIWSFNT